MDTPISLSITDLDLASTVCEVRYDFAFLIFDRTGSICLESNEHYPDLKMNQASPASTSFTTKEYLFAVEQAASRVYLQKSRHDPKEFGEYSSPFFELVFRQLEIRVLTRIGLRQVYFKTFPDSDDAINVVKGLKLQHPATDNSFGLSTTAQEGIFRWETDDLGVMFHVVGVPGNTAMAMSDVLQIEEGYGKKYKSAIIFDVDYYTIAPTLRTQWGPQEWIAQSSHLIKKGIRNFLRQ